jgi:hypothetical protein
LIKQESFVGWSHINNKEALKTGGSMAENFCSGCGKRLVREDNFCPNCGKPSRTPTKRKKSLERADIARILLGLLIFAFGLWGYAAIGIFGWATVEELAASLGYLIIAAAGIALIVFTLRDYQSVEA